ncbi:MAG: hypothetical protein AAGF84_09110 [Planctomycetota bacterium]
MPASENRVRVILFDLKKAASLIDGWKPNTEAALALSEPYAERMSIEGVKDATSAAVLSLACAVTADAYREDKRYVEAADMYQRAAAHCPKGGFAGFYAAMVVDQKMEAHYSTALHCLRESQASWRKSAWYTKAVGYMWLIGSILRQPWNMPGWIRAFRREKTIGRELEEAIDRQINGFAASK